MLDFTLAPYKDEMVQALSDILCIESVKGEPQANMPYGKEIFHVLMRTLNMAESMDLESVSLFSHMGYVEYGEGDEVFAILTHLDVVPAGEGWTVPPFAATVKDGRVYGRGAQDNKGPAIAALYALNAINQNCISLNKRVRLIFGCDEECGWSDIAFYKDQIGEEPQMAISPDAEFPIINSEKGLLQLKLNKSIRAANSAGGVKILNINGGGRVNVVPAHCECMLKNGGEALRKLVALYNEDAPVKIEAQSEGDVLRLICKGNAAHGSRPETGKNAIAGMVAFLNTLPLNKDDISDAVYQLARYIGTETDGQSMGIAKEDDSGATTLNLGYIKTEEDNLEVGLDIRYPVHTEKQFVLNAVKEKMTQFNTEVAMSLPAHFVSPDSTLVQGLSKAYEEVTGEKAELLSMGGATYARAFKNAVAFGPLFPGQKGTEHQPDEYIEIDSMVKLAEIIANAIIILCK